mmetsp:Transcript_11238/g.18909  ORF Transcript_11238/g.18909 Transcript_11238/m.18909 type:complete len:117 (+) Transcript_11238:246-596(+)
MAPGFYKSGNGNNGGLGLENRKPSNESDKLMQNRNVLSNEFGVQGSTSITFSQLQAMQNNDSNQKKYFMTQQLKQRRLQEVKNAKNRKKKIFTITALILIALLLILFVACYFYLLN